jgi:hypothetical protein
MKNFIIWEVKNGWLLHPTNYPNLDRKEVVIKAKSRYDALVTYANGATSKIYFKGEQPYYSPYDSVKYVAFLKK